MPPPATIAMISASFGSGHDVAATDLTRRLSARGISVRRYDFVDLLGPRLGPATRSSYARQLAYAPATWGWALRLLRHPRVVAQCAATCADITMDRLTQAVTGVDAVVSTYPLASLALGELRRRGLPVPVITFFTDLSVHPLWVSDAVDLHLAPTQLAAAQAQAAGARRVTVVAPPVDQERFRPATPASRAETRRRYGLPVHERLALISSGSWGVGAVAATARDVLRSGEAVPVIACGQNEVLRRRMVSRGYGPAIGWTDEMAELIGACDLLVTNAGGMTGMEAIACGVPVVAYRPLPGHGVTNAAALHDAGMGIHAKDPAGLAKSLADPWPLRFGEYAVAHPHEVYSYPDPADVIIESMNRDRTPNPAGIR